MFRTSATWILLAVTTGSTIAQFAPWVDNQISTEICIWKQPRAAIIRDIIYLDGGDISWTPRLDDGRTLPAEDAGNNGGIILGYNLSMPFDSDTNVTAIFLNGSMSKARGGQGNSNGAAPNYFDGGMLANDAQFFLYGGAVLRNDDLYDQPEEDELLSYQAYEYGPDKPTWQAGFVDKSLPENITRYVAYGGAVNAPSENLAWYFSGLTSPTHGQILTNSLSSKATNVSNNFITLDMEDQMREEWTNVTLPGTVKGRANPELVWVPVGERGILVVLGGVTYPEWAGNRKSPDEEASKEESPEFMQTIDIYDVAGKKWYKQETEDGPGARTRGCAVVAPASDQSSFNIYYYGGFDGISPKDPFSDEVWVLSIPSFTWTLINEGTSLHARAGHKCFMPYPDQMMIIGGYTPQPGRSIACLDKGPVVMFNLTSGEWMDGYDPDEYSDYGVNEKIVSKIGGDAAGSATATTPAVSGWATSALSDIFETPYDTEKITTYWPYGKVSSTSRPEINPDDDEPEGEGSSTGLPKWVAPVLGVVLGLMLVTGILVIFCLWRRRRIFKNRSSDSGTEDAGMRIISWMRGQGAAEKAPTVSTSEVATSPRMEEVNSIGTGAPVASRRDSTGAMAEMADTHIVELADTSPPAELHDTGLSPLEIIQKHSHFAPGRKPRSTADPSYSSFSVGQDHASTVSRSTDPTTSSAPLGRQNRIASDVSGVSETDATVLHNMVTSPLTPRSADSEGFAISGRRDSSALPSPPILASPLPEQTPVSPPTADDSPGQDYISVKPTTSPVRKSMFVESEEDMGKHK